MESLARAAYFARRELRREFVMDAPNGSGTPASHQARLLLLYTDPEQAAALSRRLSTADYELISCPLSASGAGWLEELCPDLVLLDPPPDQTELLQTCEHVRKLSDRPTVVVSECDADSVIARVLATGMDEYFVLPIGDRELIARIDALLRRIRRYAGAKEKEKLGDFALIAADLSAERGGRKVFLSPIEFRLVSCLASAPGKVLTHQTLMSRVWGAEYVDSRHYLRVYIRYLREKLEDDPANPQMILSEWGVGYRFQPPQPTTP